MSHNYSYRRPSPAKDLKASSFDSPDHLHPGDHSHNVSSQEPPSHSTIPSYPYSSSRASAATESPYSSSLSWSDPYSSSLNRSDQTLLSSCGLEPKDLSLLAEMPEDLITVENLPHLVLEIKKKKRATQQSPYPAMISYPPAATSRPPSATPPPGRVWEQGDRSRSQTLDYPLDIHPSLPPSQLLPTEQAEPWQLDRHDNSMQYTRSRLEPVPVQVVDYHYGKETPSSYQTPRSTYSTAQGGNSNRWKPPNSSQPAVDYRYPPLQTTDYRPRPDQDVPVFTIKMATSGNTPTKKAALDFHGEIPQKFPYSCSVCDITVLSEKYWLTHANGTQHADGQLTLLKMYPEWDCRMQTTRNGGDHTERPNIEEKTGGPSHRLTNYLGKPSSSGSRETIDPKTKGSGKVVCAKFTAQCLNEDGLKDLIKPFGEVVKIIMFPALAFVEMGSTDQATDIVTYYLSNPVMVKGGQATFSVSSTFNFLQSSRVLRFTPVPSGKESVPWKRELLAVAKRFGPVEQSLFLPTQAFVEMTNALDAQKLVGYHTSKHLKIDEIHIKVAFSSEYNTLPTISDRKSSDRKSPDRSRKSENRSKRKRTSSPRRRSLSPRRDSPTTSKSRRSRERDSDRHKERVKSNGGGKGSLRSPSKQSSSRSSGSPRRPRSPRKQSSSRSSRSPCRPRFPSKQSSSRTSRSPRSHTKERFSSEKTPGSGKTDPKKDKVSPTSTRSQPPTKDKTPSQSSTVMEKSEEAVDKTDQRKKKTETQEDGATEACDMDSDIEGVEVIGEDSDIEGMAVYGEDGEENSDMGEEEEGPVGEKEVGEAEVVEGEEDEEESEEGGELEEVGEKQEEGQVGEEEEDEEEEVGEEEKGEKQQESAEDLIQELSATGSEQGKAFSATVSEQGKKRDGEDQKADASYVDEEEHDFPEGHENLITLDDLEQDSSADDQDNQSINEPKSRSKSKPSGRDQTPGRVIYVKNLPRGFYTDSDFLEIVKGFGRVHRYFLLRNGEEGFIEMEKSSDATKALRELRYDGCKLYGQKLIILRSQKYKRLTIGWKPESDSDSKSDQKKDHSNTRSTSSSSRIRRWTSSQSKSAAKDEETREEDEETREETREEDEETREETREEDEETREEDEETREEDEETREEDEETREEDEETDEEMKEEDEEDEETKEEDEETKEEDEETKEEDEETKEEDEETKEEDEETKEEDEETKEEDEERTRQIHSEQRSNQSSDPAKNMDRGASKLNTDKFSNSEDQNNAPVSAAEDEKRACSTEDNVETKMEDNVERGPDYVKTGMESSFHPNNPVGREFIKPVMGYFCNLCQVIYVNEDEAKNQHCSSLCHYLKFMEHSGKDTASS
ncbi:matrin-3 [Salmo salar]|uniref:Matrin-3 n=1 Tax=Salmo salar TaxID=8030 RepID=A0A1S3SWS4_SALSA|nr:matrin-3-like [Salmo salar]